MNQALQYPDELLQEAGKIPSVCLVLPFEPQINEKSHIECRIKSMLARAEARLLQQYSNRKAIPVLSRMAEMIDNIAYYNYKKSIGLLASPYASKLFYLNYPVTETVRTGEDLDIRDIVKAKSKASQYLVLVLGNGVANTYEGGPSGLSLIKHNEQTRNGFLHEMDLGLGLLLRAYPLPVFVLGQPDILDAFKQTTQHTGDIMAFVPGNFDTISETAILMTLQPELHQWNKNKRQLLLQKLHKAREEGVLCCGVKEVWNAATHRRSMLLVVEEGLMSLSAPSAETGFVFARPVGDPLYQKDLVDDIIEKVLRDGGDVEFVETGTLGDFLQIALIEFHHAQ